MGVRIDRVSQGIVVSCDLVLLAITTFSHRLLVFAFSLGYRSPVTPRLNSIKVAPAVAVRPEHIGPFHPNTHARNRRTGREQRRLALVRENTDIQAPEVLDTATCMGALFLGMTGTAIDILPTKRDGLLPITKAGTEELEVRISGYPGRGEPPLFDDSGRSLSRFIYFMLDSIRTFKRYARYMAPSRKRRSRDQCLFFSIGLYCNSTRLSFSSLSS